MILSGVTGSAWAAFEPAPLPDAAGVMRKVVERAQNSGGEDSASLYTYEKRSTVEEFDSSGKVTKTTEEVFNVFPIQGVSYSRLVRIKGHDLTEKEIKEQNRKEEEFRKNLARPGSAQTKTNEGWLDPALVERFTFQVVGREQIRNRSTLALAFQPKAGAAEKSVSDRVLGRLAGTLWVDEEDWEVSKVKVHLTTELSLGLFGMVGSIKQLEMEMEQTRLPDGVWIGQKQTVAMHGRKVFSPMRFRAIEESSNFRKP
jgi:hypothetical protein